MTEQEQSQENIEALREEIREGIEMAAIIVATGQNDSEPIDPRLWRDLPAEDIGDPTSEEKTIIKEELYQLANIDEKTAPASTYLSNNNGISTQVAVFEVSIPDMETEEDYKYFVHEIQFEDGNYEWMVASTARPLEDLL